MWFLVLIVALCILSQVSLIEGGYIRSSLVQSVFPTHKFHRRAHVSTMSLETQYFALENPSAMHKIVIAVKMLNFDRLTNLVDEVSDPRSRHYGQHLSRDKVAHMIGNPAAVETIKQYLHEHGATIVKVSTHGEFITAEAPVTTWNKVFDTQLHKCSVRNHITEETNTFIRAKEYSLPVALVDHVAEVFNLVQVPPAVQKHIKVHKVQKKAKESGNGSARSAVNQSAYFPYSVTPAFINSYYNISNNTGSSLITQSVYETSNQSVSPSDLTIFQTIFGLPNQSIAEDIGNHVFDGACETSDGSDDCDEANLDVQYLMGVAQNSPTVFYYWGGEDFMLDWITEVADMSKPPTIFSISYGAYEEEYDSAYLYAFNQQAVILAAIGTTIFVSSGDDGVAGYLVRDKPQLCGYYPQFPASSPMVTTVGATNGPQEGRTEVVCQSNENGALITSGGGFSNIYPRPSWQKTEVATYFSTVAGTEKAPEEGYSLTGRGYPDVALLGHAYVVIIGGQNSSVDGTSASAPVMAAFATLVNSRRVELGLSTLGWLNPALYYYSDSFIRDITAGNNNCTASDTCCSEGFYAAPGWDPTTGLGSVMFDRFLSTLGANVTLYNDAYDDVLSAGSNGNDKHKLTKGEIAGIVIGVFIGAAAIALAIAVFVFGFGRGHLLPLLYSATSNEK